MFSPVPQWYLAGWTCPQQLTISTRLSTAIQSFLEKRREAQSFPYKLFPYRLQPTNRIPAKFQNWTQGDLIKWVLLVTFDLVWPKPLLSLYNNRRSIEDQLTWVKIQTASEFTVNKIIQWWNWVSLSQFNKWLKRNLWVQGINHFKMFHNFLLRSLQFYRLDYFL